MRDVIPAWKLQFFPSFIFTALQPGGDRVRVDPLLLRTLVLHEKCVHPDVRREEDVRDDAGYLHAARRLEAEPHAHAGLGHALHECQVAQLQFSPL